MKLLDFFNLTRGTAPYDVLGLGEVMLRLSPTDRERINQGAVFEKRIGGSEFNVLSCVSVLGGRCGLVTKLPDSELGTFVIGQVRSCGVTDEFIIRDPGKGARLGVYYYEAGAAPRKSTVIYDRAASAVCGMTLSDIPARAFSAARVFHTSGITLALSPECRRLVGEAMRRFREQGALISFDVNYRANQWGEEEARDTIREVLTTGAPACLMTFCENLSYAILDNLMARNGVPAQAGIGVAKKINMLAHCIVRGMSQGVLPLIGFTYSAGMRKRMRSAVRISAGGSIVLALLCTAVSFVFAMPLVRIFNQNGGESIVFGAEFLRILCLGGSFSAWAYACISIFQGVGRSKSSLTLALMRKGALDIPLMFLLRLVSPVYGIVAATPAADMVVCLAAALLYVRFVRRHGADKAMPAPSEFPDPTDD